MCAAPSKVTSACPADRTSPRVCIAVLELLKTRTTGLLDTDGRNGREERRGTRRRGKRMIKKEEKEVTSGIRITRQGKERWEGRKERNSRRGKRKIKRRRRKKKTTQRKA